jgi:hypothetical protein
LQSSPFLSSKKIRNRPEARKLLIVFLTKPGIARLGKKLSDVQLSPSSSTNSGKTELKPG